MIDRIHHVGIVVHSADAALGFFRDTMGLQVTEEQGVRGVLLSAGENEIELLEPTRDDTGVARFLQTRGQTLHHICFNTDNVDAELARLKGLGVDLIDQEPRDGLHRLHSPESGARRPHRTRDTARGRPHFPRQGLRSPSDHGRRL